MNTRPQAQNKNRNRRSRNKGNDLWRAVQPVPEVETVAPTEDTTALIRSLGAPPLHQQSTAAEHYLREVVERAAKIAWALAVAEGLNTGADTADEADGAS